MTQPIGSAAAKLLTTEEACLYFWGQYDTTTKARLYRAYKAGQIKSSRPSGNHWWPMAELQRLIDQPVTIDGAQ